jgi:hypothetical protein
MKVTASLFPEIVTPSEYVPGWKVTVSPFPVIVTPEADEPVPGAHVTFGLLFTETVVPKAPQLPEKVEEVEVGIGRFESGSPTGLAMAVGAGVTVFGGSPNATLLQPLGLIVEQLYTLTTPGVTPTPEAVIESPPDGQEI